ncbi:MAG: hypothetical protein M3010_00215 [Candidatus Dormibacteraeota bacterium]|nr:hypothetical protein [Candidatus Dormibacteraeota bacterium]
MADLSMETLLHPPFENDPPLKLNVNAKTLGLILAILYALFALFSLIGIPLALAGSALLAATGYHGIAFMVVVGAVIAAIGDVLVAWGGYKMYQLNIDGKRLVIYGLALAVVASVVGAIGNASVTGVIGSIIINGIIYYLVVISRFPSEAPLVTSGGVGGGAPPPSA